MLHGLSINTHNCHIFRRMNIHLPAILWCEGGTNLHSTSCWGEMDGITRNTWILCKLLIHISLNMSTSRFLCQNSLFQKFAQRYGYQDTKLSDQPKLFQLCMGNHSIEISNNRWKAFDAPAFIPIKNVTRDSSPSKWQAHTFGHHGHHICMHIHPTIGIPHTSLAFWQNPAWKWGLMTIFTIIWYIICISSNSWRAIKNKPIISPWISPSKKPPILRGKKSKWNIHGELHMANIFMGYSWTYSWLVGGFFEPLWKIFLFVNWDDEKFPINFWENVPNAKKNHGNQSPPTSLWWHFMIFLWDIHGHFLRDPMF